MSVQHKVACLHLREKIGQWRFTGDLLLLSIITIGILWQAFKEQNKNWQPKTDDDIMCFDFTKQSINISILIWKKMEKKNIMI